MASNTGYINGVEYRFTTTGEGKIRAVLAEQQNQLNGVTAAATKGTVGTSKLSGTMAGLAKSILPAVSAMILLRKGMQFMTSAYKAAEQQDLAMRKLSATLQSTGRSAMFTTKQLEDMATKMQRTSKFGDEDIMSGAIASLLRFDSIGKDVFERALQLTIDLASESGDLAGAARTLGISLEDPILGMSRLRRAGVSFTQAQQDVIKNLVETGKKAEAQTALLDLLGKKYATLAQSQMTGTTRLKNAWGDYLEFVGGKTKKLWDGVLYGMGIFFENLVDVNKAGNQDLKTNTANMVADTATKINDFMVGMKTLVGGVSLVLQGVAVLALSSIQTIANGTLVTLRKTFAFVTKVPTGAAQALFGWDIYPFVAALQDVKDVGAVNIDNIKTAFGAIGAYLKEWPDLLNEGIDLLNAGDAAAHNLRKTLQNTKDMPAIDLSGVEAGTAALTDQNSALKDNSKYWGNWAKWVASKIEEFAKFRMPATEIQGEVVTPDDLIASITNPQTVDAYQALIEENRALYDGINAVVNSMVNGFSTMLTSGRSFADSMKQIFKDMVSAILAEIAKMVAAMAVKALFNAMTGGGSSIVSVATSVAASAGVPASDTVMGEARYITPGSIPAIGGGVTLHSVVSELRQLRRDVYQAQPTAVQMDFKKGHLSYAVDRDRRYRDVMQTA